MWVPFSSPTHPCLKWQGHSFQVSSGLRRGSCRSAAQLQGSFRRPPVSHEASVLMAPASPAFPVGRSLPRLTGCSLRPEGVLSAGPESPSECPVILLSVPGDFTFLEETEVCVPGIRRLAQVSPLVLRGTGCWTQVGFWIKFHSQKKAR